MARSLREQVQDGVYHLMSHTRGGVKFFYDDPDREAFLARLRLLKAECLFKVLAYNLLGNHFHLVLQVGAVSASVVMQRLMTYVAMRHNRLRGESGHLVRDRYAHRVCMSYGYLCTLVPYVHLNAVKDGFAKDVGAWWPSSHQAYLGRPDLLTDSSVALELLGGLENYLSLIENALARLHEINEPWVEVQLERVREIAREEFLGQVAARSRSAWKLRVAVIVRAAAEDIAPKLIAKALKCSRTVVYRALAGSGTLGV